MAGIVDGQPVDATASNSAWLAKNGDDTTIGIVTLANTAAASSGPQIDNAQGAINIILDAVGGNQYTPATAYGPLPANTISALTHEQSLGVLARFFQGATGHNHAGTDGQGPLVIAVQSLAASGHAAATGAVTLSAGNLISLNQSGQNIQISGTYPGLPDVLSVANGPATAGINMAGGEIAGISVADFDLVTTPSAPSASHVAVYAKSDAHLYRLTAASAETRVDFTLAASGSTALYGDTLLAASGAAVVSQSGHTITIYAPVSAASGSAVNSIAASGSSGLTGNVTLSAGTNITLTQAGQNIKIDSSGGGGGGGGTGMTRFVLEGETVPYTCINGPHYVSASASLATAYISMLNSGTSGSTTIRINQYTAGALAASATSLLVASSGNPAATAGALSSTLSLAVGDIITVDVTGIPTGGTPSELSVEF